MPSCSRRDNLITNLLLTLTRAHQLAAREGGGGGAERQVLGQQLGKNLLLLLDLSMQQTRLLFTSVLFSQSLILLLLSQSFLYFLLRLQTPDSLFLPRPCKQSSKAILICSIILLLLLAASQVSSVIPSWSHQRVAVQKCSHPWRSNTH